MPVFVAFLRGINVGGNRLIDMAALRALFEALALAPMRTLLNSGNVVFSAEEEHRERLSETLELAIDREFGFRPAVIVRSTKELAAIVKRNPFSEVAKSDPGHLVVMSLAAQPDKDAASRLAKAYDGPEQIRISGENVYITYPNGIGTSKLTNVFLEKQLGVVGTARNWNTITKVLAIAREMEAG